MRGVVGVSAPYASASASMGMSSCLDNNPGAGHRSKLLSETGFRYSHGSFRNNLALLVEHAVMARLVSQIDPHLVLVVFLCAGSSTRGLHSVSYALFALECVGHFEAKPTSIQGFGLLIPSQVRRNRKLEEGKERIDGQIALPVRRGYVLRLRLVLGGREPTPARLTDTRCQERHRGPAQVQSRLLRCQPRRGWRRTRAKSADRMRGEQLQQCARPVHGFGFHHVSMEDPALPVSNHGT